MYDSMLKKTHCFRSAFVLMFWALFVLSLTSCSVKLVQPYDSKLINDTEAFYKKGAEMIIEGQAVSPQNDDERDTIANPEQNPAHFSKFVSRYDSLIVNSEALLLRAISRSQEIDSAGQEIQEKINELIDTALPTNCPELKSEFGKVSLTAQNFVDLKCLIVRWKEQHRKRGILKQANWEGRKLVLFQTIYAIQKAESLKKEK